MNDERVLREISCRVRGNILLKIYKHMHVCLSFVRMASKTMSGIGMQDQTQATGESGLCVTGQPHKFFYTLDNRKPSASG